jgi:DNA-binding NarL/FixJ family response regulator
VVLDPPLEKQKIQEDLLRRKIHHLPPGYKDSSKDDEGIGDLLIWYTILEIGKSRKKSVIFVSGEEKSDWWYKSEGQTLYPRYELTDEFRRFSEEQSFHIISFSNLLDLYDVSEDVISEVREKELQNRTSVGVQEMKVLELAQQGFTNEEIANELELDSGTVRNYLSSAYSKLGARNRVEAIQKAIGQGILESSEPDTESIQQIQEAMASLEVERYYRISTREKEILRMVQRGLRNQEIAIELNFSEGTVRNYISDIYRKLDARNRLEAIQKAVEIGLLTKQ